MSKLLVFSLIFATNLVSGGAETVRLLVDRLEPYDLVFRDGKFIVDYKKPVKPWRSVFDHWSGNSYSILDTKEITHSFELLASLLTKAERHEADGSSPTGWVGCSPEYVITKIVESDGQITGITKFMVSFSSCSFIVARASEDDPAPYISTIAEFDKFADAFFERTGFPNMTSSQTNSEKPANGKPSPSGNGESPNNSRSAPRQPPEGPPPAKPGSAPQ